MDIQEPLLYFQFDPPTARATQDGLIRALKDCTRFRLHHAADSTEQLPHYKTVEFESLELAKKAYATLQKCPLRKVQEPCSFSLSINEDPTSDPRAPASSKLLNVTELPPEMTAPECYDNFVEYGPIFSCEMQTRGSCKILFCRSADADKAQKEMNFATIGTYQIIVREPSKYDTKDSFKTPRPLASTPFRRVFSENQALSSNGNGHFQNQSTTSLAGPPTPFMSRSVSQPIRITDPVRIILQNVPLDMPVGPLFAVFSQFGDLKAANLANDKATGLKLGVGVLRYAEASEASRAVQAMNGQYIEGDYKASQPLHVKLFEPKGTTETTIAMKEGSTGEGEPAQLLKSFSLDAAPSIPSTQASRPMEADLSSASEASSPINRRDASFSSATTAVTTSSEGSPSGPSSSNLPPELQKHRKLLLIALQDLEEPKAAALADLLVKMPEEERKKCIFEESYLLKKVEKAKALFFDGSSGSTENGNGSPTRLYNRDDLLRLYSPTSMKHMALETVATEITSPPRQPRSRNVSASASTSPTSPRVEQRGPSDAVDYSHNPWSASAEQSGKAAQNSMNLDTLVRFSVKGIMDLASSSDPPFALSARDADKVVEVDTFLAGIAGLKSSQQKQKIGEKVFKMFKARAGGTMKNMSKKTVTLLDQEDLNALLHLCEEFPEVLVAKATVMEV